MTASVVTFANQIGAGGFAVARAAAAKLRYRYYDWEVFSQAAAEAGVSPEEIAVAAAERAPSFLERMMLRLANATSSEESSPPAAPGLSIFNSDDYGQFIEHVVLELAQQGDAVIVGHAGGAILRDRPSIFKVLIRAGDEARIARLIELQGASAAQTKRRSKTPISSRPTFTGASTTSTTSTCAPTTSP